MTEVKVETGALINYGRERYEDAVTFDAISRHLMDVGAIPSAAWGTLPNSDQLRRDWTTALDNRIAEAQSVYDEMVRMSDGVCQVAADYEGVELQVSANFDVVNADLAPYLGVAEGYTGQFRTRPGGAGVIVPHYDVPQERRGAGVTIPPGNGRLNATRHENLPSIRITEEPLELGSSTGEDLTIKGGRTTYYEGGDQDGLNQFLQEYRSTLLQLEGALRELATGRKLPL